MTPAAESTSLTAQTPEIPLFLKCTCAHCGHVIEYFSLKASEIIECPKCREKSRLPEHKKMSMIEAHGPPVPTMKICSVCGATRRFLEDECGSCEARQRSKALVIWTVTSLLAVLVVGGVWYAIHRYNARVQTQLAVEWASQPSILPQPVVAHPKSLSDLQPQKFWLQQERGSDFVMAVGDVLNDSENTHYRVRLELELVDATGATVGTVRDDSAVLGPRQSWHVAIPVKNPKAKNVKLRNIKEDQ